MFKQLSIVALFIGRRTMGHVYPNFDTLLNAAEDQKLMPQAQAERKWHIRWSYNNHENKETEAMGTAAQKVAAEDAATHCHQVEDCPSGTTWASCTDDVCIAA